MFEMVFVCCIEGVSWVVKILAVLIVIFVGRWSI